MTPTSMLDLYFLDARSKLIDLAAFLDRVERAGAGNDVRMKSFRDALKELNGPGERAHRVLFSFSDPTTEPAARAETQSASGAWNGSR